MKNQKITVQYMAVTGMLCALSFVAVLIGRVIPNVAGFLSYDPKDVVVVIAGFIYGPLTSLIISVIVSFIEMITISATGPYGFIMNIVSTCSFAIPAAIVYKKLHTHKGAVGGLALGVAVMAVCMVLWNYIVTPHYMGVPREKVAEMLATVFLPFNLGKGGVNMGLTLLLYKPIVGALRKTKLLPPSSSGEEKKVFNASFTITAVAVLLTFALLMLVLMDVI